MDLIRFKATPPIKISKENSILYILYYI